MVGHRAALDNLPDDILFLVLENLETARDRAHIGRTCRTLNQFMTREGWRAFSRRCFPGVFSTEHQSHGGGSTNGSTGRGISRKSNHIRQIDADIDNGGDGSPGWNALAESLTWQSRAWDRRALAFQALLPRWDHLPRHGRPRPYRPSLAVHFQPDLAESGKRRGLGVEGEEMLVCGAGEDIFARFRKRTATKADADVSPSLAPVWRVLNGQHAGFRPGFDDVRAVSVIENALGQLCRRGILAGRDNGDVSLLSAEPDETFGHLLARFIPEHSKESGEEAGLAGAAVDQSRIYSIDVSANGRNASSLGSSSGGLAAVTTPSDILFYPLLHGGGSGDDGRDIARDSATSIHPATTFAMGNVGLYHNGNRQPYNARWMAADGLLAVAMGAGPNPLRYLTMTPAGAMELTTAYTMPELLMNYQLNDATLILPTALEPVPPSSVTGGNGHLVLTGWRDGTCRLQDLRTASPWDLIYQDNVMGSLDCAQALLIWGADRFVTGNQASAGLKIFDLRWPRHYYHTEALPCSSAFPFPVPPMPMGAPGSMGMDFMERTSPSTSFPTVPTSTPHLLPPSLRSNDNWPPPAPELPLGLPATARCDMLHAVRCRWHTASRDLFYRPGSSLYLERSLEDHGFKAPGVFVLAGASSTDLAPANFYVGLNDCVVESFLFEEAVPVEQPILSSATSTSFYTGPPITPWAEGGSAPHFGYPKVVPDGGDDGGYYRTVDLDVSVMENGDSMARVNVEQRPMWLPRVRPRKHDFGQVQLGMAGQSDRGSQSQDRSGSSRKGRSGPSERTLATWRRKQDDEEGGPGSPGHTIPVAFRRWHRLDYGLQDDTDFTT